MAPNLDLPNLLKKNLFFIETLYSHTAKCICMLKKLNKHKKVVSNELQERKKIFFLFIHDVENCLHVISDNE